MDAFLQADTRARLVIVLLGAGAVLGVVAAVSDGLQISLIATLLDDGFVSGAQATANDTRQEVIGLLQVGVFALTAFAFCRWVYRAYANLSALGVTTPRYSARWAVGGYFVPIVNLYGPYRIMKEIWHGSDPAVTDPNPVPKEQTHRLITAWWALFLLFGALGLLSLRLSDSATVEGLYAFSWTQLGTHLVGVAGAVAALLLVRRVNARQQEKHRRSRFQACATGPPAAGSRARRPSPRAGRSW